MTNPDNPETTETRTEPTAQTPPMADTQRNHRVDEVIAYAKNHPLRMGVLGSGVIAALLPWLTFSVLNSGPLSGNIDILADKVYLIGILTIAGYELLETTPQNKAWLVGGISLTGLTLGSMVYIMGRINQMMSELGIISDAVNASLGSGAYLALLVGVAITVIGYQNSSLEVGDE